MQKKAVMKYLLIFIFLVASLQVLAQKPNEENLKLAITNFNKALLDKNADAIDELVDDNINYGHSSGWWMQTKDGIKKDLLSGKVKYNKINSTAQTLNIDGNLAWVRENYDIDVVLEGKPVLFSVSVMQVWTFKHKHWILFARQSAAVANNKAAIGVNAY